MAGSCLVHFGKGRLDLLPLVGWITIRIGLGVVVVVGADPRRGGATVALCVDRKVLILVCLRAVTSSRGRGAGGRVESVSCMIVRHLGEKWPCSGIGRIWVRTVRSDYVVRTHLNSCFERRHATYLAQISAET